MHIIILLLLSYRIFIIYTSISACKFQSDIPFNISSRIVNHQPQPTVQTFLKKGDSENHQPQTVFLGVSPNLGGLQ